MTRICYYSSCITKIHSNLILYFKKSATMRLIHFSDTHLGFNDLDTFPHAVNRLCPSKLLIYAIHFIYLSTMLLEHYLLPYMSLYKVVGFRFIRILKAFHISNKSYRQIFLTSNEIGLRDV